MDKSNYYQLGIESLTNLDYQKAIEQFTYCIEANSFDKHAFLQRASAQLVGKNFEAAIKDCNECLKIDKDFVDAYIIRGVAELELAYSQEALKDCINAKAINPSFKKAYILGANIYLKNGEYDLAILDLDAALKLGADIDYCLSRRAFAKFKSNDYHGALSDYNILLNKQNNETLYLYRSIVKKQIFDFYGAIEDCNKALLLNENLLICYAIRASCKNSLLDYVSAIQDCDYALSLDPNFVEGLELRAFAKGEIEDYLGELFDCNKIIELDAVNKTAYVRRAFAKQKLNDYKSAIEDCDSALSIDPNFSLALINRGELRCILNDLHGGFEDFHKALKLDVENPLLFSKVSEAYYIENVEIEKAICLLRIALILSPENSLYQFQLANLYNEWDTRKKVANEFFEGFEKYKSICTNYYIDEISYLERNNIANEFYAKSFSDLMPLIRSDLNTNSEFYFMYLFVGDSRYLTDPLLNNRFYFNDVRDFSDKVSDCPLLNPINQSKRGVQISYDNIRIRCLCKLEGVNSLSNSLIMWDRYANAHTGIVYKLKINKSWLIVNSVYTGGIRYGEVDFQLKCDSPEDIIYNGLFIKDIEYSQENEWRLLITGNFKNKNGEYVSWTTNGFQGVTIECLALGFNMDENIKTEIIQIALSKKIPYYLMKLGPNSTLRMEAGNDFHHNGD